MRCVCMCLHVRVCVLMVLYAHEHALIKNGIQAIKMQFENLKIESSAFWFQARAEISERGPAVWFSQHQWVQGHFYSLF